MILGRYEILGELGRGAMGVVYRARDPRIDRIVAVKTVTVTGATPEEEKEYRERFFREAQAAGRISHPGIVTIFDVGEDDATRTPYIVMEFLAGQTLENLLSGPPAERPGFEETLEWMRQLCDALGYAHSQGIIHRDVKPANVILTPEGRAKITDFGIAKLTQAEYTMPGQVLGTPNYMSPEQLTGKPVDARSDLFSLGVVFYRLLTGERPFSGDATTVAFQVAFQDPAPPSQRQPHLSPEVDLVLKRALAKDPQVRYQNAAELAGDIERLRQGQPLAAATLVLQEQAPERTMVRGAVAPVPAAAPAPATVAQTASADTVAASPAWQRWANSARARVGSVALALRASDAAWLRRLPGPWRVRVLASGLGLAAVVLLLLAFWPASTAKLVLTSNHSFRQAQISLWVDGALLQEDEFQGETRRRGRGRNFFRSYVRGQYSTALEVPAGEHTFRVRVSAPNEGYDQTQEIEGDLEKDQEQRLKVSFVGVRREMILQWE